MIGPDLPGILRAALNDARPQRLGVAVSGGGDSMAALDAAMRVADVRAVTVDHRLRPEAAAEAGDVAAFCAARNTPHETLLWNWNGQGNVSARARNARYALIGNWAVRSGVDAVILGHTQDDVAETFLMRLSRGSGVDGLSAMRPVFRRDGVRWLRPLLGVSRASCRDYLIERRIDWADDPTNDNPSYLRTRARRALRGMGIEAEALADTAHRLAEARAALDWTLRLYIRRNVIEDRGDLLLAATPDLPPELIRRLHTLALRWVGGGAYPPRQGDVQLAFANSQTRTLAGCVLLAEGDRIRITREHGAVQELNAATHAPWDARWRLDGHHAPHLRIAALGDSVSQTPWRDTGLPRASLRASPAIWQDDVLIAAPLAGLANGWTAAPGLRGKFAEFPGSD